jgi:hypothetical protein
VRHLFYLTLVSGLLIAEFSAMPNRSSAQTQDRIRCFGYVKHSSAAQPKLPGTRIQSIYIVGPNCFFSSNSETGQIILRACQVDSYCQVETWRTRPQRGMYQITEVLRVSRQASDSEQPKDLLVATLEDEHGTSAVITKQPVMLIAYYCCRAFAKPKAIIQKSH